MIMLSLNKPYESSQAQYQNLYIDFFSSSKLEIIIQNFSIRTKNN